MQEQLLGKDIDQLKEIVTKNNLPAYSAKQLAEWLYKKRVQTIDAMSNISKKNRDILKQRYCTGYNPPVNSQESIDGTKKYLFRLQNSSKVEAAYIPEEKRKTLCVSSQAGCKMNCTFCMTGKQGFNGQLTAGEIINQILSIPESEELTNIVYMGMGEPMDNIDEVIKSIKIITSEYGMEWSPRRINVSTIGIIPAIKTFIEECEAHLAISMHTPFHEERKKLMPIESKYPITEIIESLRNYDLNRQRNISFEYILFKDLNDTHEHIKGITKLLNGLRCKINLIRFHPFPGSNLKSSSPEKIRWFSEQLNKKGITTTIRKSRGEDIFAACGLLSAKKN
ncbi:23S rRNA (adenine(2503)-C(2))-methyltransferase RlmN [Marinilabiliaceae bacterium ANBcel2]|nr:23S rRNA (adenine(2503)-C(2))-methyltransferase RlmN [Marinilabiliaceae bacterium ANBcel2]